MSNTETAADGEFSNNATSVGNEISNTTLDHGEMEQPGKVEETLDKTSEGKGELSKDTLTALVG